MKFEELHNDKETNDECLLNTVKESLNKGELCLFMSETGTFMSTGENDDTEETFRKLLSVLLSGFISITYTQMKAIFDILGIDTEEVLK